MMSPSEDAQREESQLPEGERVAYRAAIAILSALLVLMLGAAVYVVIVTPVSLPECLTTASQDCLWEKRNHGSEVGDEDFIRFHGRTYVLDRDAD